MSKYLNILKLIIHTFLFAIFPVLFLFSRNLEEVALAHIWLPAAVTLTLGGLLLLLCWAIFRRLDKAAIASSLGLLLFFSYGHVYNFAYALGKGEAWLPHRFLLALWLIVFAAVAALLFRTRRDLGVAVKTLNIASVILVAGAILNIAVFKINQPRSLADIKIPRSEVASLGERPDIYFIVLDAYAAPATLKNLYGYDNSDFIAFLKNKGFYIPEESHSNYAVTRSSLPSMLNMDYLQNLSPTGEASYIRENYYLQNELLKNNAVIRFLKERGYTYLHFGSMWEITAHNPYADVDINKNSLSEFLTMLYRTTMLYPISAGAGGFLSFLDVRHAQWERILYELDELAKVPEIREPTFTFVHFGVPHTPFVFNRDGSFLEKETAPPAGWAHYPDDYLNQLIFISDAIKPVIETILAKSEKPPVIVLLSDHGSRAFTLDKNIDSLAEVDDVVLRDYFRNFGAYYLPQGGAADFYKNITPVNIFRLVFNHYFSADFKPLPDVSYMDVPKRGYEYFDVTNRVAY